MRYQAPLALCTLCDSPAKVTAGKTNPEFGTNFSEEFVALDILSLAETHI